MQTIPQLEKEVQRLKIAIEELSVLNELAIAASSSLEVRQMLDIIVQKSIKAVKAEQGFHLAGHGAGGNAISHLHLPGGSNPRSDALSSGAHITGWILKTHASVGGTENKLVVLPSLSCRRPLF